MYVIDMFIVIRYLVQCSAHHRHQTSKYLLNECFNEYITERGMCVYICIYTRIYTYVYIYLMPINTSTYIYIFYVFHTSALGPTLYLLYTHNQKNLYSFEKCCLFTSVYSKKVYQGKQRKF